MTSGPVPYVADGTRKEPAPINAFHKLPGCIIGHGDTMVLPDIPATIFEGAAGLAVVIGKPRDTRLEREQKGLKSTSPQLGGKYSKPA